MAVELVASALLTAAFDTLFERLTSREFANFFRGKKLMDGQLNALKKKLKTVSLLLDNAEDRQLDEPSVKEWLDNLKEITFKVDDLAEEINAELRSEKEIEQQPGCCVFGPMKSILTQFDKTVQDEMKKYSEGLEDLLSRAEILDLQRGIPQKTGSSAQKSLFVPLREERSVFGRDNDKEKIVEFLLSSNNNTERIGVLPIVGMGGLGKTTLAQLAYDDERVNKDRFELRAWVTVSTDFEVSKIIKSLLHQVGDESQSEEPAVLQRQLKEALRGKKFLVVLDDVWDENYSSWDLLRSNFVFGDPRSKIIVTTRSRKVCSNVKTGKIHELESVPADDCWKIFAHHDGDFNAYPQLEKIGKEIVEYCKGLPLAVKCAGGLLRSERDPKKWESILRSRVWSRNDKDGVLPSLWLSYRCLPSPVKQCFAYCAMFPQDYDFDKEDLVLMWMAEGFLQADPKEKSLEEVGDMYFEVLVSRSFFQRYRDEESAYVMHDLVHDLATFVSGEFCLNFSRDKKMGNTSSKTRYLYCDVNLQSDSVKDLGEATHLHTYIDDSYTTNSLVKEVLEEGRFSRVLSVQGQNISELLTSAKNNLKHLRYLDISFSEIEEIPDSVCSLYNLQTLVLSYCERLSKLPTNMGHLINLRHLDTGASDQIKKMPPRMGNLKELRTLTDFVLGKADEGCSSLKELGELQHLGGRLNVRGLKNVETVDDAQKANFRDKSNLVKLFLEWGHNLREEVAETGSEREVLDALQPHTNLEWLDISGYPAPSFPNWVCDSSFSKMVWVCLTGGRQNSCRFLPPLGQLPCLENLSIISFNGVESVGWEFCGNSNSSFTPFPCLKSLTFQEMKSLKEISGCFPRLKTLSNYRCPSLGAGSLLDCETLEALVIQDSCYSMECFPLDRFLRLTSLKLSRCPKLKALSSSTENHSLTSLVIEHCPEIESFPEGGLPFLRGGSQNSCRLLPPLGQLPLECLSIESFNGVESVGWEFCGNSNSSFTPFPCLKSLRFEDMKSLKEISGCFPRLESLYFCGCPEIESFPEGGLPLSLKSLEIKNCGKLVAQNSHWDLQRLTSLTELTVIDSTSDLDSFPQGLFPTSLTSFSIGDFQHLKTLNGSAFQPIKSLERLYIEKCNQLESLPEQALPDSLCHLGIYKCSLLERRYRKEKGDDWHCISHIPRICIRGNTTDELDKQGNSASTNA